MLMTNPTTGGFVPLLKEQAMCCGTTCNKLRITSLIEDLAMAEKDPNGINQHAPGAKLDFGKPMAGRLLGLFPRALWAISEVGTFGAIKYTEGGWQYVPDGEKRYQDAGMRHYLKRQMGESHDTDSGHLHIAHQAWNTLAELELCLRRMEEEQNAIVDSKTDEEF